MENPDNLVTADVGADRRILIVDDEPLVCDVVADGLATWRGTEVETVMDGRSGALRIRYGHFDLALIDPILRDISGFYLAELAASKNTAVLFMSGHPDANEKLLNYDFPYLLKPFQMHDLLRESERAIGDAKANILRVKTAAARLTASIAALRRTMEESARLVAESRSLREARDR